MRSPSSAAPASTRSACARRRRRAAATARFAALGPISGDWGGGSGLGEEALWHAARAEDGRGPATALHAAVLAGMGVATIAELTEDIHFGRRTHRRPGGARARGVRRRARRG